MKENKLQLLSPLFLKYQTEFEKNSRSRVFAPLAEAYRKLGMTEKAMEILSQGIRFHPGYVMGYLGLAFCYFDLKQYGLAYSTLSPIVDQNRDNLRLLKLFADVCLELGKQEEALETLKYLLFINPRDKEVAQTVLKLEQEVEEKYKPQHRPIIIPDNEFLSGKESGEALDESQFFNLDMLQNINTTPKKVDYDDWMTVDLKNESKIDTKINHTSAPLKVDYDQWNVKKGDQTFDNPNAEILNPDDYLVEEDEEKNSYDRNFTVHLNLDEEYNNEDKDENAVDPNSNYSEAPLVTHTLVDLYCGQGHMEKALEVLEKILILNPKDQKTIKKIEEIKSLIQPFDQYDEEDKADAEELEKEFEVQKNLNHTHSEDHQTEADVSEEDGRRHLMSLIDEKLGPIEIEEEHNKLEVSRLVEEKLSLFLKKIQKRALDYQGRV